VLLQIGCSRLKLLVLLYTEKKGGWVVILDLTYMGILSVKSLRILFTFV